MLDFARLLMLGRSFLSEPSALGQSEPIRVGGIDKGVAVLPTFDGVWHRDSHYWRKFVGGVPNIQISTRDLLKDLLRKSSAKISGGQGHCDPPIRYRHRHRLRQTQKQTKTHIQTQMQTRTCTPRV